MNRWTCGVQLATKRVVITKFAMIRLRMRVGRGANVLKFPLRQWRFVRRQRSCCCPARREKNGDKRRENGQGEAA